MPRLVLLLASVLALAPTLVAARPGPSIPAAYRGHWVESADLCADRNDNTQMRITERTVGFYEGSGPVISVRRVDRRTIRVGTRQDAFGSSRYRRLILCLSPDGRSVSDLGAGPGGSSAWVRCP